MSTKKKSTSAKTVYAFFDFDGTIFRGDSFLDILKYHAGCVRYFLIMGLYSPFLVLFMAGFLPAYKVKGMLLRAFFGGMTQENFEALCRSYAKNRLSLRVFASAKERILWHKKQGHTLAIVSASLESWIKPWAKTMGFSVILATVPEYKNGVITGHFITRNCIGKEKVSRLKEAFPKADKGIIYAYGDSKGDRELLAFAHHPFYRYFK